MNIFRRILFFLVQALLVLFPLGTVWLVSVPIVHGSVWEFGVEKIYATELLIGCMALVVCIATYLNRRNISQIPKERKQQVLFVSILLGLGVLSVYIGGNSAIGWQVFRGIEMCIVTYMLVSYAVKKDSDLVRYILIGSLPVLLLGLFQWGMQNSPSSVLFGVAPHSPEVAGASVVVEQFGGRFLRSYGPFSHPNIFGGYAAALLCLLLVYKKKNRFDGVLVSLLLPLGAAALLVSWSRSALLGLLCAIIVLILKKQLSFSRLVPVLTVLILGFFLYGSIFLTRAGGTSEAEVRSITERAGGMSTALGAITLGTPFGVGIGNYTAHLRAVQPSLSGYMLQPVHNTPLLMLVEMGWLGSIFLVIVCILFRRKEIIEWSKERAPLLAVFVPPFLLDHYLWSTYQAMLFFFIFLAVFSTKIESGNIK